MGLRTQFLVYQYYDALDQSKFSEAIAIMQKAAVISPNDPDVFAYLGEAYFFGREYSKTLESFAKRQILLGKEKDPLEPYINGYRGCILVDKNDFLQAQALLSDAIEKGAQEPHFYYSLAKLHWTQGNWTNAKQILAKVESLDPCFCYRKIQQLMQQI